MTVTVDIDNCCQHHWVPDAASCRDWLQATLQLLQCSDGNFGLSLQFVSTAQSRALNRRYRGKTSATNVLSFPVQLPPAVLDKLAFRPLGDLAVCPALLQQEAARHNKPLRSHWAHITVHGILHLLGYDHQQAAAAAHMEQLEIEILKKFGISNPYLIG